MLVLKQRAERDPSLQPAAYSHNEDEDPPPRLFSQSGNVGIITIAGPLTNTDSPWNKYDGVTSYGEIRDALVHAATDSSVGAIVLDINSGGGAVNGVSDTADLIAKINTQIKPVSTFSDGMIASAAYWLGSSAGSVDVGKVTEAGSIGVIAVHREASKMLADMGINVTVIKAGEFNGLGNPHEPLSYKANAEIHSQLDLMYGMFMGHVAAARGMDYPTANAQMGEGRVFIGQQAVKVGLADSVSTFDAVVSKAQGEIDKRKSSSQYGGNILKGTPTMPKALTDQQIAAMAEGGLTPVAQAVQEVAAAAVVAADLATQAAAQAAVGTTSATTETKAEETQEAAKVESPELVAFLKTSLAEAQAANTDLTIQLRDAKAGAEQMTASHNALRQIAEASVDRLKVALGGVSGGVQALSDESLLAEHATLRAQFESKFKAGGVAAVSSSGSSDKESVVELDPVRQARLASTRFAK
jgi:signal peptide peptidase SppA